MTKRKHIKSKVWEIGFAVLGIALFAFAGTQFVNDSYALTGSCGSGFTQIATGTVTNSAGTAGPGQVVLYSSGSPASKYCAVLNHTGSAQDVYATTTVSLTNGAGTTVKDSGNYHYYAGPVTVAASTGCIKLSGSMTWNGSSYSYNKTSWCTAAPAPPPAPAPAPAPSPSPAPKPAPKPAPRPSPSPTPAPPPATAAPTADANAQVTAGTLAVQLVMPAGNASHIKIQYGTSPITLDQGSEEIPTNGADTTIKLLNLDPSTQYSYNIVRINDLGQTATSPTGTFTTQGFNVVVHLVDKKSKPVKGVTGSLANSKLKATSGKDGILKFTDLKTGNYQLAITYNKQDYKQSLIVNPAGISSIEAAKPAPATADFFINLDNLSSKSAAPAPDKASPVPWILAAVGLLIVGAAIFIRRRRKAGGGYDFGFDFPGNPESFGPAETLEVPRPQEPGAGQPAGPVTSPPPATQPHMGESLKDMVIKSMQEEARKKRPPEP